MQNEEPMQPAAELRALIGKFKGLSKHPDVDKKWLNKITARLEEVEAFTGRLFRSGTLSDPNYLASLADGAPSVDCTCPPGVRDNDCPVHGLAW